MFQVGRLRLDMSFRTAAKACETSTQCYCTGTDDLDTRQHWLRLFTAVFSGYVDYTGRDDVISLADFILSSPMVHACLPTTLSGAWHPHYRWDNSSSWCLGSIKSAVCYIDPNSAQSPVPT